MTPVPSLTFSICPTIPQSCTRSPYIPDSICPDLHTCSRSYISPLPLSLRPYPSPSGGSRILCFGADRTGFLVGGGKGGTETRSREAAIAEGKKPLTTRGPEERRKPPQRGLGRSHRNRRDFEGFMPNLSTFCDPVNLTFFS